MSISTGTMAPFMRATLRNAAGRRIWTCEHEHRTTEQALKCAADELQRRGSTAPLPARGQRQGSARRRRRAASVRNVVVGSELAPGMAIRTEHRGVITLEEVREANKDGYRRVVGRDARGRVHRFAISERKMYPQARPRQEGNDKAA